MRVDAFNNAPAFDDCEPFGGRVTLGTERPDLICILGLPDFFQEVADEAASPREGGVGA